MDITSVKYDHNKARSYFDSLVNGSVDYLFDFMELERTSSKVTWQVCASNYLASKYAEIGDLDKVKKFLSFINQSPSEVNDISIFPLSNETRKSETDIIVEIIKDDNQLRFGFLEDFDLADREKKKIMSALMLMKDYSPESYKEIKTYINEIYLTTQGNNTDGFMRSGTNFYMWGLILLYANDENTIPYYVEVLAHECGHTALNIINAEDELVVNNASDRFSAPFRKDARPMIGIFHAFFILSRICEVLSDVKANVAGEYSFEVKERYINSLNKLKETAAILKKDAIFTPIGKDIYSKICRKWEL